MSLEEYNLLHEKQNGLCAICQQPETDTLRGRLKPLSIDHCHHTNRVRELLCGKCNKALGLFKDNILILEAAIAYLKKHLQ
jgi:hypothetical protein